MYSYGYRYNSGLVVGAGGGGGGFTNTYSLDYDGVDDFVNTGYISVLNNASTFTFSGWYKQTTLDQFNPLFESFVDANNWLGAYTFTDGNMYLQFAPGSVSNTSYGYFDYSTVVTANVWFNLTIVYDGSSSTNADKLKCYIDGVQISLTFVRIIPTLTPSGINTFNICRSDKFSGNGLGNSDEVALWDSVVNIGDVWDGSGAATDLSLLATPPTNWYRNGDNGAYKSPQWLIPNNENKDKVSNYSFDFDGIDDKIELGNPTDLQITGAFSFSCWVNTTSTNYEGIYFKGNSVSLSDIYIRRQNNGTVRFFINNVSKNVTSSTTVNDGNWHHIMFVYVPSTSMTIYIDGSQDAQNTTSIPSAINNNYGNISIGAGGVQFFNGKIDEASIFNTDQSANVSSIYNGGEPTTLPSGAVAHYKMGEEATFSGGVWTVPDSAGSNNGTSNAMTIDDRIGEAPNSTSNALSYNMDEVDRVEDTP